ncbi:MAG: hypothetical protein V1676_02710 [Candidatus Diapherotrites archaeon]
MRRHLMFFKKRLKLGTSARLRTKAYAAKNFFKGPITLSGAINGMLHSGKTQGSFRSWAIQMAKNSVKGYKHTIVAHKENADLNTRWIMYGVNDMGGGKYSVKKLRKGIQEPLIERILDGNYSKK